MKTICQHWHTMLVAGKTDLPYKQLQSDRGFLVYVTNAYPAMKPYLKGFHLSLDLWRGDRDAEGWTVKRANATDDNENLPSQDEDEEEEGRSVNKRFVSSTGPPSGVTQAAPRFITDLESLLILSASPTPVKGVVRRSEIVTAIYGFGDASSGGFGASVGLAEGIHGRFGIWDLG